MREDKNSENVDKTFAAVCGLYCKACSWYIATTEEPERLKRLAKQMNFTEEESKCYGCRSDKRLSYCSNCKMFICAYERKIDFCGECDEYPCDIIIKFQSAMPHRIELFKNLDQINAVGYRQWMSDIKAKHTCSKCHTINSTYDLECRKCGFEPSCNYVAEHKEQVEDYLNKRNT